jgi:ubiquinone biosynthesis protein
MRNIIHLIRITFTLAWHDALFPLKLLKIAPLSFVAHVFRRPRPKLTNGQKLSKAFISLGPTFIKLGQVLSTRSDLVGEDIAKELAALRDQLPPFETKIAHEIIASELGAVDFIDFEEKPVAAASIAQVHFAKLPNGQEVAVKILRPGIEKKFERDIQLFLWIARIIEKRNPEYAKRLRPVEVVQTLQESVKFELDLRMEAAAASELKQNFAGYHGFYVPEIYWKYVSKRVLVLERVVGVKIDERDELIKHGHNPDKILEVAAKSLFKQVFDDGFFHADLHPGNVFINARSEIVPIDFGIMGRIDHQSRLYIAEILAGFLTRDYMKVARAHFDAGYVPKHKSVENFALACRAVGEPVMGLPINEISVARLLGQMFKVAEDFEMIAQPHLLLMQKTMMMSEGVGRTLNPNVNMWELAQPLVIEWAKKNLGVKAHLKKGAEDFRQILIRLPEIVKMLAEKAGEK